jgi:hypothetical protein
LRIGSLGGTFAELSDLSTSNSNCRQERSSPWKIDPRQASLCVAQAGACCWRRLRTGGEANMSNATSREGPKVIVRGRIGALRDFLAVYRYSLLRKCRVLVSDRVNRRNKDAEVRDEKSTERLRQTISAITRNLGTRNPRRQNFPTKRRRH